MIAQKGDVQIVAERHQPQAVSEQGGYEPGFADQDTVEEQLNEMQNHEKRKKGAEKEGGKRVIGINWLHFQGKFYFRWTSKQ